MSIKPKYRILTFDELQELEKEFVDFLVVNGIVADDWVRMKEDQPEKAEDIITLFSDSILEGVLRKIQYVEFRDKTTINAFHCLNDQIVLVGIDGIEGFDLTDQKNVEAALKEPPQGFKIYTTNKNYHLTRELELFNMIQSGCKISDGQMFKTLCLALAK